MNEVLENEVQEFKDINEQHYAYNSMSENFLSNLSLENLNWFWRVVSTFHDVFHDEKMDGYFLGSIASSRSTSKNNKKKEKGNQFDRYTQLGFGCKKIGSKRSSPIARLWNWKDNAPYVY